MTDDGRDAGCMDEPPKCLAGMFEVHHYSEAQGYWRQCLEYPWRIAVMIDAGKGRRYEWSDQLTSEPDDATRKEWAYMAWHRMKDKPGVREYIERIQKEAAHA